MAENGDNEKMAALEAKICHQIEYYFGDFNLPRDKLLREQIKLDEGWVSLEIMIKFNRQNSWKLVKIKLKSEGLQANPYLKNRSVYIKGFQTDATLDDIKEWLENKGQVLNIQMRRTLHKTFKGSIFVVFDSIESTKKFVEGPGQKYKDTGLLILFKDKYFQEANQKLEEDAEMKSLEKKIGCLLKFSGDLDDQTCREDLHILFSNHEGIILFKEKAKEALGKAKDANNGNLQLWNKEVTWEVLEGKVEKEALKKVTVDQQESLNIWKSKGCRFKGKGKGNKAAYPGSGKKMKFANDEHDENGATGLVKRAREETDKQEPISKQQKRENGAEDQ
uniref:HTH La-type RNA-binding domain-containing protein n=1 Tax=Mandrillus leucophaeus TaxID=9568 RepID=A0A2K6AAJ1_MANLE